MGFDTVLTEVELVGSYSVLLVPLVVMVLLHFFSDILSAIGGRKK